MCCVRGKEARATGFSQVVLAARSLPDCRLIFPVCSLTQFDRGEGGQQRAQLMVLFVQNSGLSAIGGGVRRIATQLAFSTCCGLVLQSMLIEKKRKKSVTEERRGQG